MFLLKLIFSGLELDRFAFAGTFNGSFPMYHPCIVTGDFNMVPMLLNFLRHSKWQNK
jgi:hypothetical protein